MPYRSVDLSSIRYSRPTVAPLVVAGRFSMVAIMHKAVVIARSIRAGGKGWGWRMAIGLKSAWNAARQEREAAATVARYAHDTNTLTPQAPRYVLRPATGRVRTFDVGSRRFSHGW